MPAEAFENFQLRQMYQVIVTLLNQAEPIAAFTIQAAVPAGTRDHVLTVSARSRSAANIKSWVKRVRQCWIIRKGEGELTSAASILKSAGAHDINERITEITGILSYLQFETNDCLQRRLSDLLPDYMEVLKKRMYGAGSSLYLNTGIEPMNEAYGL